MDVRGAKAPQAVPSPGQTPLSRSRPAAPGLARAGGRASCLPPDIGIATRAPRASAPPTAPPRPTDTQRRGRQPPRHRRAAPALARPGLHSPGPARPRPGWRTRVLPAPDIGILTGTLPQAAPSPGRTPPVRPQDNPGTRTPGLRPASPGLARPRPGSPVLARPRPASPGLVDARPACPRHWHRDPRTPSRWTSARLHAARLAPMYPGMADARTPPLKICTTSLTWSPILYVPAPHAPPETQALLPSRSTGADRRPVLGPDLGQVALPPGPPGQTGARSWAPTWARSPCPPADGLPEIRPPACKPHVDAQARGLVTIRFVLELDQAAPILYDPAQCGPAETEALLPSRFGRGGGPSSPPKTGGEEGLL